QVSRLAWLPLSPNPGRGGMEDSYPAQLHIFREPPVAMHEAPLPAPGRLLPAPHHPLEFTERVYACESLGSPGRSPRPAEGVEPYSLQWFLNIENQRHNRHGRWIPRLLEFAKHSGETLLGLGNGLGTDWLQYARHGSSVVVCSPSAEYLALVRRNFELRGLG